MDALGIAGVVIAAGHGRSLGNRAGAGSPKELVVLYAEDHRIVADAYGEQLPRDGVFTFRQTDNCRKSKTGSS